MGEREGRERVGEGEKRGREGKQERESVGEREGRERVGAGEKRGREGKQERMGEQNDGKEMKGKGMREDEGRVGG